MNKDQQRQFLIDQIEEKLNKKLEENAALRGVFRAVEKKFEEMGVDLGDRKTEISSMAAVVALTDTADALLKALNDINQTIAIAVAPFLMEEP